jgi:hypothetical protein
MCRCYWARRVFINRFGILGSILAAICCVRQSFNGPEPPPNTPPIATPNSEKVVERVRGDSIVHVTLVNFKIKMSAVQSINISDF